MQQGLNYLLALSLPALLAGCFQIVWVHPEGYGELRYALDRKACQEEANKGALRDFSKDPHPESEARQTGLQPLGDSFKILNSAQQYNYSVRKCMELKGWEYVVARPGAPGVSESTPLPEAWPFSNAPLPPKSPPAADPANPGPAGAQACSPGTPGCDR